MRLPQGMMNNQFMGNQINQNQPDINLIKQFMPKMTDHDFEQLKQQAKMLGISDEQINSGLQILRNL